MTARIVRYRIKDEKTDTAFETFIKNITLDKLNKLYDKAIAIQDSNQLKEIVSVITMGNKYKFMQLDMETAIELYNFLKEKELNEVSFMFAMFLANMS